MKDAETFYIGWQGQMPDYYWKRIRPFIILSFAIIPVLAFVLVYYQRPFNDHVFELGQQTEMQGTLYTDPVPMLIVDPEHVPRGFSNSVLLVNFGKFGAEASLDQLPELSNGIEVVMQGTLIYGDGRVLLELTDRTGSLVKTVRKNKSRQTPPSAVTKVDLKGQIMDPKCYFGVMKPGEGKIHKSCAIRCISGGIPPVLRTTSEDGANEYYIVLGARNEKINHKILQFVGEPVCVEGEMEVLRGWNIVRIKPSGILYSDESVFRVAANCSSAQ